MFGLFKKKPKEVTFTIDEKIFITMMFDHFKDYAIKKDVIDDFERGITSKGLELYALSQEDKANNPLTSDEDATNHIIIALTAYHKAYLVYPLPHYLFYKAKYLEQCHQIKDAIKHYEKYIDAFMNYVEKGFDKELLGKNDLVKLMNVAASRLKKLRG